MKIIFFCSLGVNRNLLPTEVVNRILLRSVKPDPTAEEEGSSCFLLTVLRRSL